MLRSIGVGIAMIATIGVLPSGFVLAGTYSSSSYDQSVYGGTATSAPPSIQIGCLYGFAKGGDNRSRISGN